MKIVTAAFLACFTIYSISPLTCTYEEDKISGRGLTDVNQVHFCLYLAHLLQSSFEVDSDSTTPADQDQDGDDHLLIKKRRGILSSKNLKTIIALSMAEEASLDRDCHRPDTATVALLPYLHPAQDPIFPLYSDSSPPSI